MGRMPPFEIRLAQMAGYHSVDPDILVDQLDDASERLEANVITLTEATPFRETLTSWAKRNGWEVWHPPGRGPAENAILVKGPLYFGRTGSRLLTQLRLRTGRSSDLTATVGTIRHPKQPLRVRVGATHLISGVERPGGFVAGYRQRLYRAMVDGFAKIGSGNRRIGRILAADGNLNMHRDWVQRFFEKELPGVVSAYDFEEIDPKVGTHRWRLIDGVWTNLSIVAPTRVIKRRFKGLDHKYTFTVLRMTLAHR